LVEIELVKTNDEFPVAALDALAEMVVRHVIESRRVRLKRLRGIHRDTRSASELRKAER
jgi:hypothetical protein